MLFRYSAFLSPSTIFLFQCAQFPNHQKAAAPVEQMTNAVKVSSNSQDQHLEISPKSPENQERLYFWCTISASLNRDAHLKHKPNLPFDCFIETFPIVQDVPFGFHHSDQQKNQSVQMGWMKPSTMRAAMQCNGNEDELLNNG